MVFMVGEVGGIAVREIQRLGIGRMWTSKRPHLYEGERWGFDNGAFRDFKSGTGLDEYRFQVRLERAYPLGRPFLAVAPDIVCGGMQSLDYSLSWIGKLPRDWPWLLAVQDGMTPAVVEEVLPLFDGLFLGGSDRFKCSALTWSDMARRYNKLFHYARCGSSTKIRMAHLLDADSADSNVRIWIPERFTRLVIDLTSPQPDLFGIAPFSSARFSSLS